MSKKSKFWEEENGTETTTNEALNLTHTALGVFQDESSGHWALAKVKYNPVTKQAGQVELLTNEEGTKEAINLRFKITAVSEGLVS